MNINVHVFLIMFNKKDRFFSNNNNNTVRHETLTSDLSTEFGHKKKTITLDFARLGQKSVF